MTGVAILFNYISDKNASQLKVHTKSNRISSEFKYSPTID